MKVLVVGSGAREHAIAWKLNQSPRIKELLVAPGNAGTARIARNVTIDADDIAGLLRLARESSIDFTVVGPEAPLAAGIADLFHEEGLLLFGPTRAAARIEASKSFAKELMLRHGVPTGRAAIFDSYDAARDYVGSAKPPVVVKADGLAAAKGVTVANTVEEAQMELRRRMVDMEFGAAGKRVLIEEHLEGKEMSVFAFVDGERISPLAAACDYKRVGDGDTGPNTGGMGSYSPPDDSMWNNDMAHRVRTTIMEPVVRALADEGTPYCGVLYAGLMLTDVGPKVIEFNCRMGDPEAQAILPRLNTDLLEVMIESARGDLRSLVLDWEARACVGVVVASGGYPGSYDTGHLIGGLDEVEGKQEMFVFHAGTKLSSDSVGGEHSVATDGGRVLTVAALGDTRAEARSRAYAGAGLVSFPGSFYRRDIAVT